MPIFPLPQFEADLEEDRKLYESLKPPTSIVVRFGVLKMIGEFPYDGDAKPGCGSKLVVRTHRGTEIGEMLTSTCPNAGCSKSITRKQMLEYIENSGGKEYPFFNQGRVLRVATTEDLNEQARLEASKRDLVNVARNEAKELGLPIKIVEAEPLLGGERVTFYFTSEDRVDFRDLVTRLAGHVRTRVEMRQIGARDEARVAADYEKCGQHCCCKQFLKVLKPVSMKSAKTQKATLDPLKISGRCGRLMCCLRYEDQTYTELQKRLPKRKWRVETSEGPGTVIDGQILTQLVLVRLDRDGTDIAVPVEEITVLGPPLPPGQQPRPAAPAAAPGGGQGTAPASGQQRPRRDGAGGAAPSERRSGRGGGDRREGRERRDGCDGRDGPQRERDGRRPPRPEGPSAASHDRGPDAAGGAGDRGPATPGEGQPARKRRRRRRRRGRAPGGEGGGSGGGGGEGGGPGPAPSEN